MRRLALTLFLLSSLALAGGRGAVIAEVDGSAPTVRGYIEQDLFCVSNVCTGVGTSVDGLTIEAFAYLRIVDEQWALEIRTTPTGNVSLVAAFAW